MKEVRYKQSRGRYKSRELNNQAENQAYIDAGANWKVRRRLLGEARNATDKPGSMVVGEAVGVLDGDVVKTT